MLSVCMIVKNEEKTLSDCLSQTVRFADELIVVDTGSTDDTKALAFSYGAQVYDFVWCDDFAAARNYSFEKAHGDYLMWLDADHILTDEAVEKLIVLKNIQFNGTSSVMMQYDSPDNGGITVSFLQIVQRHTDGSIPKWQGAVHERLPVTEPVLVTDIVIRHRDKRADNGAVNLKSLRYAEYSRRLTQAELRANFWLCMQCSVDLTFAGECEEAEAKLSLALSLFPPLEELLRTCLLAGNNFLYWRREREALGMYHLFLEQAEKRGCLTDSESLTASPLFHKLLLKAQKVSYSIGETELSMRLNDMALQYFPDSLCARMNKRWFMRFAPVTISVCMIVRDEEPVIERCLRNVVQFADELIVVDTGSVDRTKEIAAKYTDWVYDYEWNDDFSAARNFSYSKACSDYIMWLDADDDIEAKDIARIQYLKAHMPPETDVVFFNYTGDSSDEDIFSDSELLRDRLIRRTLHAQWVYPIHEGIPIDKKWKVLYRKDICIFHRKEKINEKRRNLRIFEKKMTEGFILNSYNRAYYVRELCSDGQYEQAMHEYERLWKDDCAIHRENIDYALFFYIECMKRLKQYDRLEEDLQAYLARFGAAEMVYCTLGDLCRRRKIYSKALYWYDCARMMQIDLCDLRLHDKAYHAFLPYMGMAKLYLNQHKNAEAEAALKKAEALHPKNIELKLLKLCLERRNRQ
ncbi:MAG: glycosyltransferase family 2 protein [Treponema sp.]|nr:glycosyltransferase family 2 protein [Treponema sp.]